MRPSRMLAAAALVAMPGTAFAGGPDFCSLGDTDAVSWDVIALYIKEEAHIGLPLIQRLSKLTPKDRHGLSALQAAAALNINLCHVRGQPAGPLSPCSKEEEDQLRAAGFAMQSLVDDAKFVRIAGVPQGDIMESLFTEGGAQLYCVPQAAEAPQPETPADTRWSLTNFRVRGSGTDLIYARDSSAYSDVDKAVLSFGDDKAAGKSSTKFVAALGYSFDFGSKAPKEVTESPGSISHFGVIPYGAINIDTSRKTASAREFDSHQFEIGAAFQWSRSQRLANHRNAVQYIALIPRLVWDRTDKSQLFAANLIYRPDFSLTRGIGVNRLHDIGQTSLMWDILLDARMNYGHFTRAGTRMGTAADDFWRLGGRIGIGLTTRSEKLPIELTVAQIRMFALDAASAEISQLKSDFSIYFNKDKNFGIDIGYARGRAEDLDKREQKWTIGFSVKY